MTKRVQGQTDVTQKWTQRVVERRTHLNHTQGPRRGTNIYLINIYLTDSNEEAIVDFGKDQKELYDKNTEHFKDKARKECLWERFTNSHKYARFV